MIGAAFSRALGATAPIEMRSMGVADSISHKLLLVLYSNVTRLIDHATMYILVLICTDFTYGRFAKSSRFPL